MSESIRTWGPPVAIVVGLPLTFLAARALLPAIGGDDGPDVPVVTVTGSATCEGCHAEAHAAWSTSTHAGAERPAEEGPGLEDGTVRLVGPSGETESFTPVRAIGVDPLVQYLVPFDNGRLQVTQTAWDPAEEEWFDIFDDGRGPGEWGHWTGGAMTWNSQCATCHSTFIDKAYDPATQSYETTAHEFDVGCEACHGAGEAHASGGPPPVVSPERWVDVCASCHARRADLTGAFVPGEAFLDHFAPTLVDLTDVFWPDGQVHAEDFEWTSFLGSRMYAAGIRCVDCHDPHTGATLREGDALCLGCHEGLPGFELHDPHPAEAGVGCAGCHMPITVYMQRDPRHDHGFHIPDPALGTAWGIPDACTRCHEDQDARWAADLVEGWWGPEAPPQRALAEAVARSRAGDPVAVERLLIEVATAERGTWRATAASGLEPFLQREDVRAALLAATADPDPYVRFAAGGAVAPAAALPEVAAALQRLAEDPLRAVRVQAGRGLRSSLPKGSAALTDYEGYLAYNADQPTALHEHATWLLEQGRLPVAIEKLEQAVAFDPFSPQLHDTLALAWSAFGRPAESVVSSRRAAELAPDDAELAYRLGLAEAGAGDLQAAARAMERAVGIDGSMARPWYNLGLVRLQLGDGDGALTALATAVERAPQDPEIRYGLASALLQLGRMADAKAEAQRILAIDPAHPGARAVLLVGSGSVGRTRDPTGNGRGRLAE